MIMPKAMPTIVAPTKKPTKLMPKKLKAFGFDVVSIDGHNVKKIIGACGKAKRSKRPTAIILNTIKGKGVSFMENNPDFHGRPCTPDEKAKALKELEERIC